MKIKTSRYIYIETMSKYFTNNFSWTDKLWTDITFRYILIIWKSRVVSHVAGRLFSCFKMVWCVFPFQDAYNHVTIIFQFTPLDSSNAMGGSKCFEYALEVQTPRLGLPRCGKALSRAVRCGTANGGACQDVFWSLPNARQGLLSHTSSTFAWGNCIVASFLWS